MFHMKRDEDIGHYLLMIFAIDPYRRTDDMVMKNKLSILTL